MHSSMRAFCHLIYRNRQTRGYFVDNYCFADMYFLCDRVNFHEKYKMKEVEKFFESYWRDFFEVESNSSNKCEFCLQMNFIF